MLCNDVDKKVCFSKTGWCECVDGCEHAKPDGCTITKMDTCPLYGCPKHPILAITMEDTPIINPVSEVSENDLLAQRYLDACRLYLHGSGAYLITNAPEDIANKVLGTKLPEDLCFNTGANYYADQLNKLGYIARKILVGESSAYLE